MDEFDKIKNSIESSIEILSRTLALYEKVKNGQTLNATDVSGILKDISSRRGDLNFVLDQLKQLKANPFHLKFIKIHSEHEASDMAVRLLNAMAKTSPGKEFPPAVEMANTLGIVDKENRTTFTAGYTSAVSQLKSKHASAQTKSFNIWYWICMSMFGTFAVLVILWIARKFYELVLDTRKNFANFVMPKRPLSKFKLFTFANDQKRKFGWPFVLPMAGPSPENE